MFLQSCCNFLVVSWLVCEATRVDLGLGGPSNLATPSLCTLTGVVHAPYSWLLGHTLHHHGLIARGRLSIGDGAKA